MNAALQTDVVRSPREYNERLGWVLLHEILSHATARLRGSREIHAPSGGTATDADRITAWLAGAMATPAHVQIANVSVDWNWDPDTGVHDPLASS
ncbi:MAG: hypothetical protein AB8I08_01395 [Sandaracinaceae bacterium]